MSVGIATIPEAGGANAISALGRKIHRSTPCSKSSRWNFFRKPMRTLKKVESEINQSIVRYDVANSAYFTPIVKLCFLMELDEGLCSVLAP
jgi:hypothetical protein